MRGFGVIGHGDTDNVLPGTNLELIEAEIVQSAGIGRENNLRPFEHQDPRALRLFAVEADHGPDVHGAFGRVESRHIDETIVLRESEADDSATPQGSFGITAESRRVLIEGKGSTGLRNGVVKLVNLVGLARAPILRLSKQSYEPRVPLRVGKVPWMGSYRDLVFMGYNGAVLCGDADKGSFRPITGETFSLYALSTSDAIPELKTLRNSEAVARLKRYAEGAHKYELKLYIWLNMRPVFAPDHPVFKAHPDTRGALMYDDKTWYKEKGKHVLCTESPLVRRYISETIRGIFKDLPGLSGIGVIIGGEEFHHCFMRPYGVERGHTNCPRCERLGHNTVVANLCNTMATAAREVNPAAEIFAWPYSAVYVWSVGDPAQRGLIDKLKPGVALFSDLVKDETVIKSGGIKKLLWDYSIDLAGVSGRPKSSTLGRLIGGLF